MRAAAVCGSWVLLTLVPEASRKLRAVHPTRRLIQQRSRATAWVESRSTHLRPQHPPQTAAPTCKIGVREERGPRNEDERAEHRAEGPGAASWETEGGERGLRKANEDALPLPIPACLGLAIRPGWQRDASYPYWDTEQPTPRR